MLQEAPSSPSRKDPEEQRDLRFLGRVAAAWGGGLLWVVLTPSPGPHPRAAKETAADLARYQLVLTKHVDEWGYAPFNLRQLKIFSYGTGENLKLYDSYGQRFNYYAIGLHDWLVQSFGYEGLENTLLSSKNPFVASWSLEANAFLQGTGDPLLALPPMSLGVLSADAKLMARLYQHPILEKSYLVVSDQQNNAFAMVAWHDRVEEFLWLPDNHRLAFVGTSSSRYRDGLYIWDLHNNQLKNLLDESAAMHAPGVLPVAAAAGEHWHIKLAAVNRALGRLAAWVAPRSEAALSPSAFFSPTHLRSFALSNPPHAVAPLPTPALTPAFQSVLLPQPGVVCEGGALLQQEWCHLPASGLVDAVLEAWQGYVEQTIDSPLFAYGLWSMAFLYNDAYALWRQAPADLEIVASAGEEGDRTKTQQVLRSYAIELAHAVVEHGLAASWQKATARALWEALTSSEEALNLHLVDLRLGVIQEEREQRP